MTTPWCWVDRSGAGSGTWMLVDGRGRDRATIWRNGPHEFTWHTWDEDGVGGENAESPYLEDAKRECVASIVYQGWAPGGWTVTWK